MDKPEWELGCRSHLHALDVGGPDGLGPRSPVSKAVQVPHAEQSKGLQC